MKHKKEIQVLYIITKLELGGAQKVCLSLLEGLQKSGHTAALISGPEGKLIQKAHEFREVYLLPEFTREVSIRAFFHEIKNFINVVRYIRKLKKKYPNLIVHTHSTKAGIIGRWAAWCAGIKNRIHTVHGYGFHQHLSWPAWLAIYTLELITSCITTHFVCVSSQDVKTGLRLLPRFAKKHSIIRASVDWEQFYQPALKTTPFPNSNEPFIFGTVACFKPQKNLLDLFKAFHAVYQKNSRARLEVIGDGALRPMLEAWIAKYNLQHVIALHGWQDNVAHIMINWHAFVLSSLWEGLPCAIVEARLLKLPVISYDTGGIHDVIQHGENGLLYHQGKWRELADGMLQVLHDAQLHHKLQVYVEDLTDFNHEHMVHHHVNLYRELIK